MWKSLDDEPGPAQPCPQTRGSPGRCCAFERDCSDEVT